MFVLTEVSDTIRLHPSTLAYSTVDSLSDQINLKYANRVLHSVGLCISLFDILAVSEGKVRWGDGCLYYHVVFRLIVFRPFVTEVLVGRIKSSDESGIRVSLGFFDDIYVPAHLVPAPSAFDHQERAFFWLYEPQNKQVADDPLLSAPEDRMYLDTGEEIRFVVESESFYDAEPGPPVPEGGEHHKEVAKSDARPHYSITVSTTAPSPQPPAQRARHSNNNHPPPTATGNSARSQARDSASSRGGKAPSLTLHRPPPNHNHNHNHNHKHKHSSQSKWTTSRSSKPRQPPTPPPLFVLLISFRISTFKTSSSPSYSTVQCTRSDQGTTRRAVHSPRAAVCPGLSS